jgi:hypothetical protein
MATVYQDLGDHGDDQRVRLIAERVQAGNKVGFLVDNDEKADCYVAKLQQACACVVLFRGRLSSADLTDVVFVKVGPRFQ